MKKILAPIAILCSLLCLFSTFYLLIDLDKGPYGQSISDRYTSEALKEIENRIKVDPQFIATYSNGNSFEEKLYTNFVEYMNEMEKILNYYDDIKRQYSGIILWIFIFSVLGLISNIFLLVTQFRNTTNKS